MGWEKFELKKVEGQIEELASIGGTVNGGTTRLAYTLEDQQAKKYVEKLMLQAGMTVRYDSIGNLFGIYPGTEPDLPAVLMGSHLDTVPEGGKYDGIAGVLIAIELVRSFFVSKVKLKRSLVVVVFADEEGARFGGSLLGSRAATGMLTPEWLERSDSEGVKLKEALSRLGFSSTNLEEIKFKPDEYLAYLELHIEQGRVLEKSACPVGVVTGISAPFQFWAVLDGRADHAGATPMGERKDALAAAAELILAVEAISTPTEEGQVTVGTIGSVSVCPNGLNVIPGKVKLSIDIRDVNLETRNRVVEAIKQAGKEIAQKRDVKINFEDAMAVEPVKLDRDLINLLETNCRELDLRYRRIVSGAGHDAMLMAKIMPAAMIFIRCRDGISHNPDEYVERDDLYLGAKLLYHTVYKLSV